MRVRQAYEAWQRQNNIITLDNNGTDSLVVSPSLDETEAENDNSPMPQNTFRFAYVAIILIAVMSVGLSLLFMGTGEAEESDADYTIQTGETAESPFLISNTSEGWLAE